MKEMKFNEIKDTKGVWVIVDKNTEQLLVEDNPRGDNFTKTPHLLIFNDYQKANYFLSKTEVDDSNSDWVILNVNNQDIWSTIKGKCLDSEIVSGRLNTCVEKEHNCAMLVVLFHEYKNLDVLQEAILKQDYDHWSVNNKNDDPSKMYIWDWEHIKAEVDGGV